MQAKELRKLNRLELLELLVEKEKQLEAVSAELEKATEALESREMKIKEAGTLANASVQIHDVLGAAQRAADDYLANLHWQNDHHLEEAERIINDAKAEAASILLSANKEKNAMEQATHAKCKAMLKKAKRESDACWQDLSSKLDSFYKEHEGLRALLNIGKEEADDAVFDIEEPEKPDAGQSLAG